ncbi:MAG: right-handed parallel beta-helix repeat-containing protein [Bacteroidales bacterium]
MVKLATTIILVLLTIITTQSQTYVTGGEASGEWSAEGSPYVIEGDLIVQEEERLKIDAGVEVIFAGPYAIEVYGRLEALGTAADSIYFTVQDTSGFSSGNYNNWFGIVFMDFAANQTELSKLEFCVVEYSAGSGITCLFYKNLLIRHSTFRNNSAHGILLMEFSDVTIENTVIEDNKNTGMAVHYSAPQVSDFSIRNNNGGGLSLIGNSFGFLFPFFYNGSIYGNKTAGNGGGISVSMDAFASFSHLDVHSNSAQLGGGVYGSHSHLTFEKLFISDNSALEGGGIYLNSQASLDITFSVVSFNTATQNGGGLFNQNGNLTADRCTFAYNTAGNTGGGFYHDAETNQSNNLSNAVIWQNYPDAIHSLQAQPLVTYTNVEGGYPGKGNIDADPLFADPLNNNFQLTWADFPVVSELTSPCIDKGNPLSEPDPDQTIADMGAYYFAQTIITTIQNKTNETMITIYPNPATNLFVIEGSKNIEQVSIINLSGQMVRNFTSLIPEYHIADLHPGVYLVQVLTVNGNVTTRKLIKH